MREGRWKEEQMKERRKYAEEMGNCSSLCLSSCLPVISHKGLERGNLVFGVLGGAGSQAAFWEDAGPSRPAMGCCRALLLRGKQLGRDAVPGPSRCQSAPAW